MESRPLFQKMLGCVSSVFVDAAAAMETRACAAQLFYCAHMAGHLNTNPRGSVIKYFCAATVRVHIISTSTLKGYLVL